MSHITIVSVSWWSTAYLEPLLSNLRAKARDAARLRVIVVDNTGGSDPDLARLADVDLVPFTANERNGSRAHGRALDFAMPRIETEYALVIDPDVHVFYSGWDALCISALEQRRALAIGAPYPAWKIGKYHDFPSPPFCFFRTEGLRRLGASWVPFGPTLRATGRDFVLRQVGRVGLMLTRRRYERHAVLQGYASWAERRFGVFDRDTGWRIARAASADSYRSILFDTVLPGSSSFQSASNSFQTLAREYELYTYEGHPVLTHKYGSGALPWRTKRGADSVFWRGCLERLERELAGWPRCS
jgi:hypothetical protein